MLTQPDWVGIAIGAGLSLASIVISAIASTRAGRRSRKRPDFQVAVESYGLAVPQSWNEGGLRLSYKNKRLERVSRTTIAFWNNSGDPIRRTDIIASDPLRVVVGEGDKILQTRLVARSRPQCDVTISPTGELSFEFLDEGDGAVVEVVHVAKARATITGTMAGARIGAARDAAVNDFARHAIRTARIKRYALMSRARRNVYIVMAVIGILTIAMVIAGAFLASRGLGTPQLVDVSRFDLSTIAGQDAFADEVRRSGQRDLFSVVFGSAVALAGSAMLAWIVRRIIRSTQAIVPRSVVADDLDPWVVPTKNADVQTAVPTT